ncbi:MAG TPA: DUF4956 domain-containing protein [Aeromonadales bacterium]|nr:DUF4956 domain-containing protein [Aeromonadales bacterium]
MTTLGQDFSVRFLINLVFTVFLIYGSYFRKSKNYHISASFTLFGVGIFVITYILRGAEMSMGFAFGLFAVFTMLRYRTEPISIKEMTYLFLVIALALLSAVSQVSMFELSVLNAMLCCTALLVDSKLLQERYSTKMITYEKIELIKPHRRKELLDDLSQRTGLNISKIQINNIDFLRDVATIMISYQQDHKLDDALFLEQLRLNQAVHGADNEDKSELVSST